MRVCAGCDYAPSRQCDLGTAERRARLLSHPQFGVRLDQEHAGRPDATIRAPQAVPGDRLFLLSLPAARKVAPVLQGETRRAADGAGDVEKTASDSGAAASFELLSALADDLDVHARVCR